MNILFLSHERKMGGANRSLYELALAMKNRGHNVCVTVLFRGCPLDRSLIKAGIATIPCFFGWWMEPMNWNLFFKLAFRTLHNLEFVAAKKLSNFVINNNVDIIHSNSSTIDIGILVKRYVLKRQPNFSLKHIQHIREFGDIDYQLTYMNGRDKAVRAINKDVDHVIFISQALRQYYADIKCGTVIYDGLSNLPKPDVPINSPVSDRVSNSLVASNKVTEPVALTTSNNVATFIDNPVNDRIVFVHAGNLIPGKNQHISIEAMNILVNQGIKNIKLLLAGAATDLKESKQYEARLIAMIDTYKLGDYIQLCGFVDDMKSLRNQTNCEIVASKAEAYGRVTLEAMVAKNLVIASSSGSGPELLGGDDGWCPRGIIFSQDSSMDEISIAHNLANAIKQVIEASSNDDGTKRIDDIINTAYCYVLKNHRTELATANVEQIYCE